MHADSDEATGELVHDHEHPVAPEHDGLASKQIHAPQAVSRVSDERQPRGPIAAGGGTIVFRQHAVYDVLVDVDSERVRDDARNPRTAEPGIARLELDDGLDECVARPLRSGRLPELARREQAAVLAMHQRLMTRQGVEGRKPMATFRIRPGLRKSDANPQISRSLSARFGVRLRPRRRTISCCLSTRFSAITARTPPGPHSFAVTTAMQQGDQEVLHARVSVGQTPGATQRCPIRESARKLPIRDPPARLQHRCAGFCAGRVGSHRDLA